MTQEKLAELANIDPKTVIEIEAGKRENPTMGTLSKLSKILDISLAELLN